MELKIPKEWIEEGVQRAVEEIKQNFIPRSVLEDIRQEIVKLPDTDEAGVFSSIRMKGMVLQIIDRHMGKGEQE